MWLFVAVLVLWGSTVTMDQWDNWVLPDIVQWAWWTFHLYACGIASTTGRYLNLAEKVMALFAYCLVVIYYRTMSDTYLGFLPADADNPDLWPTIFLAVNLLGPLLLITVGLLAPAVQRRR